MIFPFGPDGDLLSGPFHIYNKVYMIIARAGTINMPALGV